MTSFNISNTFKKIGVIGYRETLDFLRTTPKVLCHNICCVIQEVCELGIKAKFKLEEPMRV